LAEASLKPLSHEPRRIVGRTAGRKRHDELDRPVGIALRMDRLSDAQCARNHSRK
jgi:hypothetical protein